MQRSVIDEAIGQAWPEFPVPTHHRSPFVIAALRVVQARAADVRAAVVGAQVAWEFERLGLV